MEIKPDKTALRNGYRIAQAIAKHYAKTFYFASFFLPPGKKRASYCVYALLRMCDESLDNPLPNQNPKMFENIKEKFASLYRQEIFQDSLLSACRDTIVIYKIPQAYFYDFLEGMQRDRWKSRYKNFEELYDYCYKVAGIIGLIMLKIFGSEDSSAEKSAVALGVAMQLANILRDIKEDLGRGRIYLPQDEMQRFSVTETALSRAVIDENFKAFMKFQIQRAREYFNATNAGIKYLKGTRIRLCVSAMNEIYARILTAIERNDYDVFSRRAHVPFLQKIACVPAILKGA